MDESGMCIPFPTVPPSARARKTKQAQNNGMGLPIPDQPAINRSQLPIVGESKSLSSRG